MPITISGSGTITGISAGGLPDATVTQADLAANVAGNGPAFSAYASSPQSLTLSTATKILFGTKEFDTASNFVSSRFTPTVAGYYQVSGGIQVVTALTSLLLFVFKNGTTNKLLQYSSNAGSVSGSMLIYMNGSTDYLELYATIGFTQNLGDGVSSGTFFQAAMVRAA